MRKRTMDVVDGGGTVGAVNDWQNSSIHRMVWRPKNIVYLYQIRWLGLFRENKDLLLV
jgi:hypothetical protein